MPTHNHSLQFQVLPCSEGRSTADVRQAASDVCRAWLQDAGSRKLDLKSMRERMTPFSGDEIELMEPLDTIV